MATKGHSVYLRDASGEPVRTVHTFWEDHKPSSLQAANDCARDFRTWGYEALVVPRDDVFSSELTPFDVAFFGNGRPFDVGLWVDEMA